MGSLDQITSVRDLRTWQGEIPLYQVYTAGLAGERFFREIMENGRILATRCKACRYTYLPPRAYCERCFAALDDWVEVGPRGTLRAHTVAHLDMRGQRLERPAVIGLIQLDGADGLLVHYLRGERPADVEGDLRLRAVFKPRARRRGSILDIQGFRPVT